MSIARADIRLLQTDTNSVTPTNLFEGVLDGTLPITLAPAEEAEFGLAPKSPVAGLVWNAVEVLPTAWSMDIDPDALIGQIHDLAPAGSLGWEVTAISLALKAPPADNPGLEAIEVMMRLPDGEELQVTLTRQAPELKITIPRRLSDVVSDDTAVERLRVMTRARGVYVRGFGPWSDERENLGKTLFAFAPPFAEGT